MKNKSINRLKAVLAENNKPNKWLLELKIEGNKIFAPLKNKWLDLTHEEKVRQTYVYRLVNNYGHSLNQMQQDIVSQPRRFTIA